MDDKTFMKNRFILSQTTEIEGDKFDLLAVKDGVLYGRKHHEEWREICKGENETKN